MSEKETVPGSERIANYELTSEEMRERVAELLVERPPKTSDRFICYKLHGKDFEDIARTVECTVFEDKFDNNASDMEKIYGPYESGSTFFLSVDQLNSEPVGALRVTQNSPAGIMTLEHLPPSIAMLGKEEVLNMHGVGSLDDCWDIGTVAVLSEHRKQGAGVSVQLYRAMYKEAMKQGKMHLFSIIDERAYQTLTSYLGVPFIPLADSPAFEFEGSKLSQAVYGHTPEFYKKMSRKSISPKGILARKALWPLVFGTKDEAIDLN